MRILVNASENHYRSETQFNTPNPQQKNSCVLSTRSTHARGHCRSWPLLGSDANLTGVHIAGGRRVISMRDPSLAPYRPLSESRRNTQTVQFNRLRCASLWKCNQWASALLLFIIQHAATQFPGFFGLKTKGIHCSKTFSRGGGKETV